MSFNLPHDNAFHWVIILYESLFGQMLISHAPGKATQVRIRKYQGSREKALYWKFEKCKLNKNIIPFKLKKTELIDSNNGKGGRNHIH